MERLKKGFEVEWCYELPIIDGDADIDNAKYKRRDFAKRDDAVAFAKSVLPQDQFHSVMVTEFERRPDEYVPEEIFKEYIGERECIDE